MVLSKNLDIKLFSVVLSAMALFLLLFASNLLLISGVPLYFFIMIVASLLVVAIKKERIFQIKKQELFILIFMFWLLVPVVNAQYVALSMLQYYYYFIAFYLFFFVQRICLNKNYWFLLVNALLLGGVITSLLMLVNWNIILQGDRVNLNNINANYLAYGLVTLLPLLYIMINIKKANKIYYGMLILFTMAIFLTGSRGALSSLLIFYFLFSVKKPIFGFGIFIVILSSFAILLGFYDNLPTYWQARFDFHNVDNNEIDWTSGRDQTWAFALKTINENFLLGIGPNNFGEISGFSIGVHNVFLSLLVETGIIGFSLYFLILVSIFFFIIKKDFYIGFMLALIELPIFLTGVWESSPVLWVVLSLLIAYVVLFHKDNRGGL
jgi:O-antigen ligase